MTIFRFRNLTSVQVYAKLRNYAIARESINQLNEVNFFQYAILSRRYSHPAMENIYINHIAVFVCAVMSLVIGGSLVVAASVAKSVARQRTV